MDDETRLTYRCTIHTAYFGSKVGGTHLLLERKWVHLVDPALAPTLLNRLTNCLQLHKFATEAKKKKEGFVLLGKL